jgi:HK97 family phage prohead protease
LLWQHDAREPIGFVESVTEDQRGLRVVARVIDAGRGAGVSRLLSAGAIDGLSFGYRVKAARRLARGSGGAVRALERVELVEVSVVTFPMQPLARVLAVVEVVKGDE